MLPPRVNTTWGLASQQGSRRVGKLSEKLNYIYLVDFKTFEITKRGNNKKKKKIKKVSVSQLSKYIQLKLL